MFLQVQTNLASLTRSCYDAMIVASFTLLSKLHKNKFEEVFIAISKYSMAEGIEKCTFVKLNSTCHLQHYAKKCCLLQVKNLTPEEQRLLLIRSSISDINTDEATICLHHKAVYLTHFNYLQRNKCCNPFDLHQKKRAKGK